MSDDHLSLDELAELDEGLLTPERESAVRAHLDACAQCRAGADAIVSTRRLLADLPDQPMPDDVKARLDKALADAAPTATATIVPQLETYRRRRFGRPTMAASSAAAAIVLLVGGIVVAAVMHNPSGSSGGTGGGVTSALGAAPRVPAQPKDYAKTSTGLDYTPALLLADIPGLVAKVPSEFGGSVAAVPSPVVAPQTKNPTHSLETGPVPLALRPFYNSRSKLLQCAADVSGIPNAVPIAVDFARWTNGNYHSAPSIVLILRDPNPEVVDVYVTAPDCSGELPIRTLVKVPLN